MIYVVFCVKEVKVFAERLSAYPPELIEQMKINKLTLKANDFPISIVIVLKPKRTIQTNFTGHPTTSKIFSMIYLIPKHEIFQVET